MPAAPINAATLGSATSGASDETTDTSAVPTLPTVAPIAPTPQQTVEYASFLQRVAASIADLGIVIGIYLVFMIGLGIVLYATMGEGEADHLIDTTSETTYGLGFLLIWVIYRPLLWQVRDGQSFGQALAKIRVRTVKESRMSFFNGVGRQLATSVMYLVFWPILMAIDVLWMTWDKTGHNQTLHDKIASTIVVQAVNKKAR